MNKTPLAKGKNWTCLTYREQIIKEELDEHNVWRKEIGLNNMGLAEFIKVRYRKTLFQYLNDPFDRKTLYLKGGFYSNNKRV